MDRTIDITSDIKAYVYSDGAFAEYRGELHKCFNSDTQVPPEFTKYVAQCERIPNTDWIVEPTGKYMDLPKLKALKGKVSINDFLDLFRDLETAGNVHMGFRNVSKIYMNNDSKLKISLDIIKNKKQNIRDVLILWWFLDDTSDEDFNVWIANNGCKNLGEVIDAIEHNRHTVIRKRQVNMGVGVAVCIVFILALLLVCVKVLFK